MENEILTVTVAWFLYAMWGLLSALIKGEKFDPRKLASSVLLALVAAVLALLTGLPPDIVLVENATLIEQIIVFIENQGGVIALMWFISRLYTIITEASKNFPNWVNRLLAYLKEE